MRHFMAQFGPALQWPWTKLTDVPELTDELLDKLVAQSDAQAAGRSIRELEQLRDDCLVSVIQGLRTHGFGAGAVLEAWGQTPFRAGAAHGTRGAHDPSPPPPAPPRQEPAPTPPARRRPEEDTHQHPPHT